MVRENLLQSPYACIDGFRALNVSLKSVVDSIVPVSVFETEVRPSRIRLEEATFHVADKLERVTPIVTAHDLNQYINRFYSISLIEQERCMLDLLLDWDYEGIDLSGFGDSLNRRFV